MKRVGLDQVKIQDQFWGFYRSLVRDVVIPYQHEILNDRVPGVEPSHAVQNFRIAAGEAEGSFGGMVFQDSDIAKWIEAVGYSLKTDPNPELEEKADAIIDLIEKAQLPDGYVNTYYILNGIEKRFTNLLDCHELYCLGHMLEGAIAYYEATGKRKLLDVMCRYVDLVESLFGAEKGKTRGYPGHEEIELALVKLYDATGEVRYLHLAEYFLNERGRKPSFFVEEWERRGRTRHWNNIGVDLVYNQAHLPVREQKVAVGHAVRAVYLYTGMAMAAQRTGDESLLAACRRLWDNIVDKQLYLTGGIGQTSIGEAFTFDYDLPNDTNYSETCASIGLIFFARAMLDAEAKGVYADVMEQALYNTVIAGMAQDGKHFFHVNPMEIWPEASEKAPVRQHDLPQRPGWYACACCPPNVARLLASLGQYIYGQNGSGVYVHLYVGGEVTFEEAGETLRLRMETAYPWDGSGSLTVAEASGGSWTLHLRIPGWCKSPQISVNGEPVDVTKAEDGYLPLARCWAAGDRVEIRFPMDIRVLMANPRVRADAGRVAVARGPLVYCVEEADNGENLSALSLEASSELSAVFDPDLLGGVVRIIASGYRDDVDQDALYLPADAVDRIPSQLTLIPYYSWGNRGKGEMVVWLRRA